jgi:hypothetical protein
MPVASPVGASHHTAPQSTKDMEPIRKNRLDDSRAIHWRSASGNLASTCAERRLWWRSVNPKGSGRERAWSVSSNYFEFQFGTRKIMMNRILNLLYLYIYIYIYIYIYTHTRHFLQHLRCIPPNDNNKIRPNIALSCYTKFRYKISLPLSYEINFDHSHSLYQKEERAQPGNLQNWTFNFLTPPPPLKCLPLPLHFLYP